MAERKTLEFTPEFKIKESEKGIGKIKLGGTALVEGLSVNNVQYSLKNLEENNGKQFKWIFGHPKKGEIEEHVVGKGELVFKGGNLDHDGEIMNTARHPDVVEMVEAKLLGPSIHASYDNITKADDKYHVEGLSIDAVGLVAFQGIKAASIDYAIAESFELNETKTESKVDSKNKTTTGDAIMAEEETQTPAPEAEKKEEQVETTTEPEAKVETEAEVPKEEVSKEEVQEMKREIALLKESKKMEVVDKLVEINKEFKKEDLIKESEEMLGMRVEYETKMSKTTTEAAIVETEVKESSKDFELVESKDGSVTLSESAYKAFNEEIKKNI